MLDAVAVTALAQSTRSRAREVAAVPAQVLHGYAAELDEIAEAAVQLDQKEHEIEHQLRWWAERIRQLEAALTRHPADDMDTSRELALYRGRVSGAETLDAHRLSRPTYWDNSDRRHLQASSTRYFATDP